jgi:hypothetical protein
MRKHATTGRLTGSGTGRGAGRQGACRPTGRDSGEWQRRSGGARAVRGVAGAGAKGRRAASTGGRMGAAGGGRREAGPPRRRGVGAGRRGAGAGGLGWRAGLSPALRGRTDFCRRRDVGAGRCSQRLGGGRRQAALVVGCVAGGLLGGLSGPGVGGRGIRRMGGGRRLEVRGRGGCRLSRQARQGGVRRGGHRFGCTGARRVGRRGGGRERLAPCLGPRGLASCRVAAGVRLGSERGGTGGLGSAADAPRLDCVAGGRWGPRARQGMLKARGGGAPAAGWPGRKAWRLKAWACGGAGGAPGKAWVSQGDGPGGPPRARREVAPKGRAPALRIWMLVAPKGYGC